MPSSATRAPLSALRQFGPAAAGLLCGLALLAIVAIRPSGEREAGAESVATAVVAGEPRPTVVALPPEPPRRGGVLDWLLPPRADAMRRTRDIEQGRPAARPAPALTPPRSPPALRPRLAVIIDDMGMDPVNSARAIGLPAAVTLAYLPHAPAVSIQARRARARGHALMLHLPMEATAGRFRHSSVLRTGAENDQVMAKLRGMLGAFDGYTGVNNHMGSRFTADRDKMRLVLGELKRRGLFFVDSRTSGHSMGEAAARDVGIAHVGRDVFLDHDPDPDKIRARISEAENIARQTGAAVVIGHPRRTTMDLIEPWLAGIEQRGFTLVPVADLLIHPDPKRLASR